MFITEQNFNDFFHELHSLSLTFAKLKKTVGIPVTLPGVGNNYTTERY